MFAKQLLQLGVLGVILWSLGACQNSQSSLTSEFIYDAVKTISLVDETPLTYRIDRPDRRELIPLLLVIDGSSCRGLDTIGLLDILKPDTSAPMPYARLIVEKIGVNMGDDGKTCSDEFLQNYSIDERVLQHLRALQHLRGDAEWWNGELLIWGWSDGGDIAAQLMAYYPDTRRAVLGAMGGGVTMAENFRDKDFCPKEKFETEATHASCVLKLEAQFSEIGRNPAWDKSWLGGDNSHKVWETRLFSRLSHLLIDNRTPILIVHGGADKGQIGGARKLRDDLKAAGNEAFAYWEVPNMGHSPRGLPKAHSAALYNAMRDWLLTGEQVMPNLNEIDKANEEKP